MVLHDLETADAELLPTDPSLKKAIQSHPEWSEFAFAVAEEARRNGLLAIRILSDAFFYKCGFRAPMTTAAEDAGWEKLKESRGFETRAQCVFKFVTRLRQEAALTLQELRRFMRLKAVDQPESMLCRDWPNPAAHFVTVGLMAYQLRQAFRANPDETGPIIISKIFWWLCGTTIEAAINERDMRVMTTEGVGAARSAFWEEQRGGGEYDELVNQHEEEIGSFF
jgi:hypothetical protein